MINSQKNSFYTNLKIDSMNLKNIIKNLDSSVFDGHTEFSNFTLEQKIIWLMQISVFIFEVYSSIILKSN